MKATSAITADKYSGLRFVGVLLLVVIALALLAGCTSVQLGDARYTNVGFQKEIGKLTFEKSPDGTVKASVEGVKNTTPQIVEAAVGAALRNSK